MVVDADGSASPIDAGTTYGVVSNYYVRGDGNGYIGFASGGMNAYDYGPDLADVVAENRIRILQAAEF